VDSATEKALLIAALEKGEGRQSKAARIMEMHVDTLRPKILKHGIRWQDFRGKMCSCGRKSPRCEACKEGNRLSQKRRYHSLAAQKESQKLARILAKFPPQSVPVTLNQGGMQTKKASGQIEQYKPSGSRVNLGSGGR